MNHPPAELDGATCLAWAHVEGIKPLGRYRLFLGNPSGEPEEVTGRLPYVALCRYAPSATHPDGSFYLFFCDERWEVVQDRDVASAADGKAAIAEEYGTVEWRPHAG